MPASSIKREDFVADDDDVEGANSKH